MSKASDRQHPVKIFISILLDMLLSESPVKVPTDSSVFGKISLFFGGKEMIKQSEFYSTKCEVECLSSLIRNRVI